jgi:hypothetical protein
VLQDRKEVMGKNKWADIANVELSEQERFRIHLLHELDDSHIENTCIKKDAFERLTRVKAGREQTICCYLVGDSVT